MPTPTGEAFVSSPHLCVGSFIQHLGVHVLCAKDAGTLLLTYLTLKMENLENGSKIEI